MIRFATKEDRQQIAPLLLVILKDMELPVLQEISESLMCQLLADAILEPTYRYGYARGLVYEHEGKIAGVAFGYPEKEEAQVDQPWQKILKKYGLREDLRLFTDKEAFLGEWYLDAISVAAAYRGLGIGSQLLAALPMLVRQTNESVIGLNVDEQNPRAQALYAKQGFQVVGECTLSGHRYAHMQKNCF